MPFVKKVWNILRTIYSTVFDLASKVYKFFGTLMVKLSEVTIGKYQPFKILNSIGEGYLSVAAGLKSVGNYLDPSALSPDIGVSSAAAQQAAGEALHASNSQAIAQARAGEEQQSKKDQTQMEMMDGVQKAVMNNSELSNMIINQNSATGVNISVPEPRPNETAPGFGEFSIMGAAGAF